MTLTAVNTYTQYQKTELQYEAKISKVSAEQIEGEKNNSKKNLDEINTPIIYTNESDLSNTQQIRKQILEKLLGGLNQGEEQSLYPKGDYEKESYGTKNPYGKEIPASLFYAQSSEYYEKISFEFSAQARIKTPEGEYNIEVKFSFTQEYYEKNETQIQMAQENFQNPFDIELDKDDNSLKDLKYLHFIFDSNKKDKNEEVDIFEQLKVLFAQREKMLLQSINDDEKKENNKIKALDNFNIWQKSSNEEANLVAIQKDGLGVFLANYSNELTTSQVNISESGYSYSQSYYKEESSYMEVTKEIKV